MNKIKEQFDKYMTTGRGESSMTTAVYNWFIRNYKDNQKNIDLIFNHIGENVFDVINDMHEQEKIDYMTDKGIKEFIDEFATSISYIISN